MADKSNRFENFKKSIQYIRKDIDRLREKNTDLKIEQFRLLQQLTAKESVYNPIAEGQRLAKAIKDIQHLDRVADETFTKLGIPLEKRRT